MFFLWSISTVSFFGIWSYILSSYNLLGLSLETGENHVFGNVSDFFLFGGAGLHFVIIVHVTLDVALYPAIWDRNNVPP